ncbi:MAG: type II secretion system GspH family protein [Lentisphaeraceae bacterium]|nr:type II secretion system GspH family protein [Lentisphaeraceae bacterium]
MKKFTLIELLVVVAIIGILASILLPSLSKARIKSIKAVCLSNTNQLGKSFTMNSDNHDGRAFWDEAGVNGNWPWSISHTNTLELDIAPVSYQCPIKDNYDNEGMWDYIAGYHGTDYAYTFLRPNGSMSGATLGGGMEWVDRLSAVQDPTEMPFVSDAIFKTGGDGFYSKNPFGYRTNHLGPYKLDQNVTYVDGHSALTYSGTFKQRYNAGTGYFWW